MKNQDGTLVVTFNGEIYNYRELRSQLEQKGYRFQSTCDTEVLLHLYAEKGERMVNELRGMYAFAIWDAGKRCLFLARDPYGIKPLYYADDGKTCRAASQVKALLAGGNIDTSPEPAGHVGYFLWGHVPEPYTLYRGIRNLAAGHCLTVEADGKKRLRAYCSIPGILAEAEAGGGGRRPETGDRRSDFRISESQLSTFNKDLLASSLRDSVRHHLIADVPVGVFLSSGLDSTTIAALASEFGGQLRTVTLGFEEFLGTANDEAPLAEQVSRQYGAAHQTIRVNKQDFRGHFARVMNAMDQPSCDGVNSYFVSFAAARAGLKVAMSGLGGDELFGGYPSFQEIPRAVGALGSFRNYGAFGRVVRIISAPLLKQMTSPKYAGLFEYGGTYAGAYLLRRGMFMPWELPELFDPEIVRQGWQNLQPILHLEETLRGLNNSRLKVSALESCWYMRNQLLRDSDWASMAHSLEIRVPLVDIELLREIAPMLTADVPPDKQDLSLSPSSPLPASVLNRPKTGFTVPVRQWLLNEDTEFQTERGLRGWTRLVYSTFVSERSESLHLARASMGHSPLRRRTNLSVYRKVLVFRIGQLGDTVAALPAMWAVRQQFPDAEMTLLCDRHPDKNYVFGPDLLGGSGLFQKFQFYPVRDGGLNPVIRSRDMLRLLARLRRERYNALVYLSPSARTRLQILRDRRFFRLAGIRRFIGMEGFAAAPQRAAGRALDEVPHETELLLARLAASGVVIPPTGRGCLDLKLGAKEESEVTDWLGTLPGDGGRVWIAFGPGSKMPAKRWPAERFAEVGKDLIARFDIWPVVFGGPEDSEVAAKLLAFWGRGYSATGQLSLRAAAQALERCPLYIGNDTGTMHLAASAGARCLAVFSARDWPGRWYPYGKGHRVFRSKIDCEGCGLVECVERKNECLQLITVQQVLAGCEAVWNEVKNQKVGVKS
jgi:asparagine synthase (glutamine-hydrolysing)